MNVIVITDRKLIQAANVQMSDEVEANARFKAMESLRLPKVTDSALLATIERRLREDWRVE